MNKALSEKDIKAIMIDRLIEKGQIDGDAVLINELFVGNFKRRVDLALANGKLQAFEIKSDLDSLYRLAGQMETYCKYFDKVTLVCSQKFTEKAKVIIPDRVEIIEVRKSLNGSKVKTIRRGKTIPTSDRYSILSFLDKRAIVRVLKNFNIDCSNKDSRNQLYQRSQAVPVAKLRDFTLDYIKSKYKERYSKFIVGRSDKTTVDDLERLRWEQYGSEYQHDSYMDCFAIDEKDMLTSLPKPSVSDENMLDITKSIEDAGMVAYRKVLVAARIRNKASV